MTSHVEFSATLQPAHQQATLPLGVTITPLGQQQPRDPAEEASATICFSEAKNKRQVESYLRSTILLPSTDTHTIKPATTVEGGKCTLWKIKFTSAAHAAFFCLLASPLSDTINPSETAAGIEPALSIGPATGWEGYRYRLKRALDEPQSQPPGSSATRTLYDSLLASADTDHLWKGMVQVSMTAATQTFGVRPAYDRPQDHSVGSRLIYKWTTAVAAAVRTSYLRGVGRIASRFWQRSRKLGFSNSHGGFEILPN